MSDETSVMIPGRPGRFGANVHFWAKFKVPPRFTAGA
jgi:hypothetical protein